MLPSFRPLATTLDSDEYITPSGAWDLVLPFVPAGSCVWDPFYCDGSSGAYFSAKGFRCHHAPNEDFFAHTPPADCEVIVTNPPFTLKRQVLERLRALDRPFVLLLPISALGTAYFRENFGNNHDVSIIFPPRRIQFARPGTGAKGRCAFFSVFVLYRLPTPARTLWL